MGFFLTIIESGGGQTINLPLTEESFYIEIETGTIQIEVFNSDINITIED